MIRVQNLTKQYGSVLAVDGLSFEVAPGKITGFLGPNGSGKSTTMRMILGLDRPTEGQATLNGKKYVELNNPLRTVGALLDAEAMHPGMSGRNHLRIAARSNGIPVSRVKEVLDQVELSKAANRRIGGYSLGMRQRLGIASALLGDPEILIFDEPINGLDIDGVRWMRALMRELADNGRTVFVSSHLMSELQLIADHIIIIANGRLVSDTSLNDLLNSLTTRRVKVRTSSIETLGRALKKQGVAFEQAGKNELFVTDLAPAKIADIVHGCKLPLDYLAQEEDSLEEAYLRLTNQYSAAERTIKNSQKGKE